MSNDDRVEHRKANSQSRALVVVDEAFNRELIADMLVFEGYDVVTAQDGYAFKCRGCRLGTLNGKSAR